jgi:hypothetical protein
MTAPVDMQQALRPEPPVVRARAKVSNEELAMHGAAAGGTEQAGEVPGTERRQLDALRALRRRSRICGVGG